MVGRRILAEHENRLRVFEILTRDGRLAHADRGPQRHAGRLVAIVRRVGHVVGAEGARKQLVRESRLIAAAAGSIEHCTARSIERTQGTGSQLERLRPLDLAVGIAGAVVQHRCGQAAEAFQLPLRAGAQRCQRIGREKFGRRAARRRFMRNRPCTLLAEIDRLILG